MGISLQLNDSLISDSKMPQSVAACDGCRKRKVRCDRMKPCSNCKQHRTACIISHDGARPRGRLGGRRGNRESIHARLARLEGLLETLEQSHTEGQLPTPEASDELVENDKRHGSEARQDSNKLYHYAAGPIWIRLSEQVDNLFRA